MRSTGMPAASSWSASSAATPRPSSVITMRPPGIRPRRSRGRGAVDRFQNAPLDAAIGLRDRGWRIEDPDGRCAGIAGRRIAIRRSLRILRLRRPGSTAPASAAIRSTITPSVRARARASIISGESDRAFQRGELVAELPQDLDPLDRVDSEVGLHVEVEAQGLDRVARPIADDLEQAGGDRRAIGCRGVATIRSRGVEPMSDRARPSPVEGGRFGGAAIRDSGCHDVVAWWPFPFECVVPAGFSRSRWSDSA